ncbi:N6-adenosine-specific RNA methylase IME4, partial [Dysosmobacter welbionis]
LYLQHHQLRLHRHAAQHGESRHGHDRLRHLHADQHGLELHSHFRQVRRACAGDHRCCHCHPDLPGAGVRDRRGLCPPLPPSAPDAPPAAAARRGHGAELPEIRHPRSGERGAVGSGRQRYDRRHGPHGHQHGYAGGPRHHGQHRQVLHCGLLRHRRRHRRDCGQADR